MKMELLLSWNNFLFVKTYDIFIVENKTQKQSKHTYKQLLIFFFVVVGLIRFFIVFVTVIFGNQFTITFLDQQHEPNNMQVKKGTKQDQKRNTFTQRFKWKLDPTAFTNITRHIKQKTSCFRGNRSHHKKWKEIQTPINPAKQSDGKSKVLKQANVQSG